MPPSGQDGSQGGDSPSKYILEENRAHMATQTKSRSTLKRRQELAFRTQGDASAFNCPHSNFSRWQWVSDQATDHSPLLIMGRIEDCRLIASLEPSSMENEMHQCHFQHPLENVHWPSARVHGWI